VRARVYVWVWGVWGRGCQGRPWCEVSAVQSSGAAARCSCLSSLKGLLATSSSGPSAACKEPATTRRAPERPDGVYDCGVYDCGVYDCGVYNCVLYDVVDMERRAVFRGVGMC